MTAHILIHIFLRKCAGTWDRGDQRRSFCWSLRSWSPPLHW